MFSRRIIIPATGFAAVLMLLPAFAMVTAGRADAQARPSATTCDGYARNYANTKSKQGQVLGGGAKGSLLGAGIGAIFSAAGPGAIVGATIGMIGGGSKRSATAEQMYRAAYQDCMAGRVR